MCFALGLLCIYSTGSVELASVLQWCMFCGLYLTVPYQTLQLCIV